MSMTNTTLNRYIFNGTVTIAAPTYHRARRIYKAAGNKVIFDIKKVSYTNNMVPVYTDMPIPRT